MELLTLDALWAESWLRSAAKKIREQRAYLSDLDRAIGDGDHGENLDRGFGAVAQKLEDQHFKCPGHCLEFAGTTLMATVGGAAGPLYGTAFLRAATAFAELTAIDSRTIARGLLAASEGIAVRGKAEVGDKTMIDAWTPAVRAAQVEAGTGATPVAVLDAAAAAAGRGAESTDCLIARRGRASYLGARSAGHRDPGAASSALVLQAAADAAALQAPMEAVHP